jgi:uncharacterized protein YaeQ
MAANSTIYRGKIQLSDVDRGCYEQLELTLAQHPSETGERLVARILAYALCYEQGLTFTKGICEGDSPDISYQLPGEKMKLWVEAGEPSAERMLTACRKAEQVELFLYAKHPWRWEQTHLESLRAMPNLKITLLPGDQLTAVSTGMKRGFDWSVTVTDGVVYLDTGGVSAEFELKQLLDPR